MTEGQMQAAQRDALVEVITELRRLADQTRAERQPGWERFAADLDRMISAREQRIARMDTGRD